MKINCRFFLFFFFVFCLGISPAHSAETAENRWIFGQKALENAADLEKVQSLIKTAKASGFNGIVLSSRFDSLDRQPPVYIERLKRLIEFCNQNDFNLIPCGFSVGYASALLYYNANLAEGFPVRDLMFKVLGSEAVPKEDRSSPQITDINRGSNKDSLITTKTSMSSGESFFSVDFDNPGNTSLILENPGKVTFADAAITHSGRPSLRLENFSYNSNGNARICKELDVTPYSSYEISFWYRAEELAAGTAAMAQIYTMDGHALTWRNMGLPTTAWQRFTLDFNSLEHKQVRIYLGVWGGKTGKVWIDDLKISRPKTLTRLIRRTGAPVTVTNAITELVYSEGSDFDIKEYPQGSQNFIIGINPQGSIHENTPLKVSYFRSYVMGGDQTCVCMALPDVYEAWEKQVGLIEELFHPKAYFLSMDEIRQGGYCDLCGKKNMAQLLGQCITKQYAIIKSFNKDAKVYMWGDMLDPNMGATNNYCMVRGGFSNSWEYVPKEIVPVVWNYNSRDKGLLHFRENGFTGMASINVDEDASAVRLKAWKDSLSNSYNKLGIMYTTWHGDYSHLKEFGVIFYD